MARVAYVVLVIALETSLKGSFSKFILKALQHNTESALETLDFYPAAFGSHTLHRLIQPKPTTRMLATFRLRM